ncbi:asparagine synthase-related protein [Haloarcula sp. S1CR25-12]|uniref:Putative asparagine synthetase [glutamine-hydrolyzing] n=1 Tax=Haloarcula saliterrae TaxID=2950534 RepID=A0ABU2FCP2_9EURY|nr:asparagine synthase-related protein [Haloarcula sp. S1CR25-12]MDS0260023.1 asparagine synthase-related protein [Haloarcula sp. S1CR25-12]
MSGISAVLCGDGTSAAPAVRQLTAAQSHRGPQGSGYWCGDAVALGHQHNCTLPEARGRSFPRQVDGVVVTAALRLDNRAELCAAFGVASEVPDTDLVAHAYRRWGVDYPRHLVGAFAAVVWDPERRRLVCARDHMGVKPVYYAETADGGVALASEPGPLLGLDGVRSAPDEHRIGDFLVGRFADSSRTFYEDVSRLPPAHRLVVTDDGLDRTRYWSLSEVDPLPEAHRSAYDERFRDLFERAVADRRRSVGPVGSLLSGGLDSSSIAGVAATQRAAAGAPPLRTFSAVFDTVEACDEGRYIDAVLGSGAFDPHYVDGDGIGPLVGLDRHLDHRGQPYYPSLCMLIWRLFEVAGQCDTGVVLNGYGGDQTMGSDVRGYLRGLLGRGQLPTFAREFRGYLDNYPWLDARDALWDDIARPLVPDRLRRLYHRRFDEADYLDMAFAPLDGGFARRSGLVDRIAADQRRGQPRTQRAIRRRALTTDEPAFNLELNDIAGAAHGVEPRFPYFDKRLVEFAVALPPGHTVSDGLDRTIVRRALADVLPAAVRDRTDKAEFSPNVVYGLQRYDTDLVERTLADGEPAVGRYLDGDALANAVGRLRNGLTASDARTLAMATTLERWLQRIPS